MSLFVFISNGLKGQDSEIQTTSALFMKIGEYKIGMELEWKLFNMLAPLVMTSVTLFSGFR